MALIACGNRSRQIEPELESFVKEFEKVYGVYYPGDILFSTNLPTHDKSRIIGQCIMSTSSTKILISKQFFEENKNNPVRIKMLMYHELGHCAMRLPHDDRMHGPCAVSLMHSKAYAVCFNIPEYYYKELGERWKKRLGGRSVSY